MVNVRHILAVHKGSRRSSRVAGRGDATRTCDSFLMLVVRLRSTERLSQEPRCESQTKERRGHSALERRAQWVEITHLARGGLHRSPR
jgi:hypothetical protein